MAQAFLPPPNLDNITFRCALIRYPDDEAHFFRTALLGQLYDLARPYSWEYGHVDNDQISQLWLQAIQETIDIFYLNNCDILDAVEEGDLAINVTVNTDCGGCGCGGGTGGADNQPTQYQPPLIEPLDRGQDPPPELPGDTWEEYDAEFCRVANYLASRPLVLLRQMGAYADGQVTTLALVSLLTGVFGLFSAGGVAAWLGLGATGIALINILGVLDDLIGEAGASVNWGSIGDDYEANVLEQVVCDLYNQRDSVVNPTAVAQVTILSWIATLPLGPAAQILFERLMAYTVGNGLLDGLLFKSLAYASPANEIDCTECLPGYDYQWDFGTADDGHLDDWEPDGSGRVFVDGAHHVNFAPNTTFEDCSLEGRHASSPFIDGAIGEVYVTAARWNASAGDEAHPRVLELVIYSAPGVEAEVVTLVSGAESLAMVEATAPASVITDENLYDVYTATATYPSTPYNVALRCDGNLVGNVQIQVGEIRWTYQ